MSVCVMMERVGESVCHGGGEYEGGSAVKN